MKTNTSFSSRQLQADNPGSSNSELQEAMEKNAHELETYVRCIFDALMDPTNVRNLPIEIRLALRCLRENCLIDASEEHLVAQPATLFMLWTVAPCVATVTSSAEDRGPNAERQLLIVSLTYLN